MIWSMDTRGLCLKCLRWDLRRSLQRSSDARETEEAAGEFAFVEFVCVPASSIRPRRNASRYVMS